MKILIAEDDTFIANAYRVKFSKSGFEARVASDGEEALRIAKEFKPDLIILDLMMPIKDGFTALIELKQDNELQSIPIIIASNLGQKEDIDKGMKLGANDFIIKTNMSLDELIQKVNKLTQNVNPA